MRYLFYFYSSFNSTMFGGLLDEAIELSNDPNNEVLFAYCGNINDMCIYINSQGSKSTCKLCKRCTKRILDRYKIKNVSLSEYRINNSVHFDYHNANDLRDIKYRNVNIGLSIMSDYISATRNQKPLIDESAKIYFDAHLKQNVAFVDALYNLIGQYNPDVIYSFNGRFEEVRPVFDICATLKIKCILTEVIKKNGIWFKVSFKDNLPHDIKYNIKRRNYCWDNYNMSEYEKIQLGNSFYKKRRNGEESGDVKIYVANQKEGNISCFKPGKRNIAIFNSSEDEFAAVGGDWDKLKLFDNQFEGIKYILENADDTFHFILRVHPNLMNIPYKFHKDLYKLPEKYSNITVIPADSNASTYTIMENCEKIICFGSTMGIESSYWGKVAILLGPSLYYYDDVVYVPKSKDEIMPLLIEKLEPKNDINIIKFGAYILNKDPLIIPNHYINCNVNKHSLFGRVYSTSPYINYILNERITGLYIAIKRYFAEKNGKYKLPQKEE